MMSLETLETMRKNKHKIIAALIIGFPCVMFLCFIAGAAFMCEHNGGTPLENWACVDMKTIGYCQYDDHVMYSPVIPNMTNITGLMP